VTIVPRPERGRVYETSRGVRVADADPTGRLRLDAVARFVQDVGNEDVANAGLPVDVPWVVRRSLIAVDEWPRLGERLAAATWCGGTGSRWAERRVSFRGASGTVDVATLVVHLDENGRPTKLPSWFDDTYAEAAMGRTLTTRLTLPSPPDDASRRAWPVRFTDLDVMGHVNNAITWAAVEDECARLGFVPMTATVEWTGSLEADDAVELWSAPHDAGIRLWLVVDRAVRVAAEISPRPAAGTAAAAPR
jgi:acyl-ACP thioesterase